MATKSTKGRRRVTLRLQAEPGKRVFVAGSFNDWQPTGKRLKDKNGTGDYEIIMLLPQGRYEYKFVVDGDWCIDPECPEWTQNDLGSLNSVITVD